MINIYLFLGAMFLLTLLLGRLLQKIRVPWIFAALLLGVGLSVYNPFEYITESEVFVFLSNLGMYFLLFIISFEIDLREVKKQRAFIFKGTLYTMFLASLTGIFLIHYLFDYSWLVSLIVALSFSTVGEAILIPILNEFKIVNTRLGQTIIGIGILDDVSEILILIFVILFIGVGVHGQFNLFLILFSLLALFGLTYGLTQLKRQREKFHFTQVETLFLFSLGVLLLFLGIGQYAEASALGAILAGVGLRTFIPDERLRVVDSELKAVCYGLFAPIFFLWAGAGMDIGHLVAFPLAIFLIVLVSSGSKYLGAYLVGRKTLGLKQSLLLGTGLSVRFSTSIVVIKLLYDNGLIKEDLYSIILASSVIFTFVIPLLFLQMLKKFRSAIV